MVFSERFASIVTKLVVLHQGAIGDFLLTLSVIQAVRETLGADEVTAVATASSARLAAGRSAVDEWRSPEDLGLYRLFCSDLPLSEQMAEVLARADWVLNFLCGPGEGIDERLRSMTTSQIVSVDPRPTTATREHRRHITSQWAEHIRHAGWPVSDPTPARIDVGDRTKFRSAARPRRILVHPGSGGEAKCWPLDRFFQVADMLNQADVAWMLGPAELELARSVQARDEPLLVEDDLAKAAEQMSGFDLYLGNDSGMTHLAAALGLKTIAIFAATDPRIWRPLGDHVSVVAPDEVKDSMETITPEEVRDAILSMQ